MAVPTTTSTSRVRLAAVLALTLTPIGTTQPGIGGTIQVVHDTPAIDVWNYPFNSTRGYREAIQTFSAVGQEVFPGVGTFDQRDGQYLVGFDTAPGVPSGRGPCGYFVQRAVIRVAVSRDLGFQYDPTYDPWTTYVGGATDADGRPLEVYGAAFRGQSPGGAAWSELNYFEGTAAIPGPDFGPSIDSDVRYVFPTDNLNGVVRDVSNNVRDMFDPKPFALGISQDVSLNPGDFVPVDTVFVFDLNVQDEDVQSFLRRQVDLGRIRLMITALQPASSMGGPGTGEFATFYSKEVFGADGLWASLDLEVRTIPPADTNRDGVVTFDDVTLVLSRWNIPGAPGHPGDANCDGIVDFTDVIEVLGGWGQVEP